METNSLNKAIMLLNKTQITCALCNNDVIITDTRRGIRPLLDLLEARTNVQGFSVADKVVGKAAAYLYCLLKIDYLYARVISIPALTVLQENNIAVQYENLVPFIRNRSGDGLCPMEQSVLHITSPDDALTAIQDTLKQMNKKDPMP